MHGRRVGDRCDPLEPGRGLGGHGLPDDHRVAGGRSRRGGDRRRRQPHLGNAGGGLRILDGAIFGYPPQIGTANIQIVYSGDRAVYDTNRGVLDAIAGMSPYLGAPPHLAKALDVSMLVLAGSTVVAAMEGIAQGMAHGLELSDLVGLFNAVLKGHAALLAAFEPSLASGDHSTIEATIRTWRGGIQTVVDAAADAGTRSRMAEAAVATLDDAIAAGWGDAGMTAIVAERLGRTPPVAG